MKLWTLLAGVPVAVIAAVLAVANREEVAFKLDPFGSGDSVAFVMPLFLLVFLSFLLGVLVGGATIALRRGRNARRENAKPAAVATGLALDGGRMEPPGS
jgi:uncharacterized integral membrane protein